MPDAKIPISDDERSRRFIEKAHELGGNTAKAMAEAKRLFRKFVPPKTGGTPEPK
jgi:hypothetical protein